VILPLRTEHSASTDYRADIDGLRAVAVLAVVGFHAFPAWVPGGFIGVDIFFVISGFLISTIIFGGLDRQTFSFATFYARRIRRIFPALLVVLAASFAVGWVMMLPIEYQQLGKHIAGGAGFVSNLVLWRESGYFDYAADTKPLLHLWSLGVEEQFYLIWPLLLWISFKKRLNFLTVTLVLAVLSFVLNVVNIHNHTVATFYSPQTRFWELMAGSALAYLALFKPRGFVQFEARVNGWLGSVISTKAQQPGAGPLRNAQSLLGLLLIVAGLVIIHKSRDFPGWLALLPTVGTTLLIAAGAQAWFNREVLSHRAVVWFGLISYPLYLWHWPLLSFGRIAGSELPAREFRIAAVLAAIALAWLTYRLIEKPIRFGRNRGPKTMALVVLMAAMGLAGYVCYARDGLPFRFSDNLGVMAKALINFKYDAWMSDYRAGAFNCELGPEQDHTAFSSCETIVEQGKPTILLWGDSNAAHLYPGYKFSFPNSNIIQRTAAACPPIIDTDFANHLHCRDINNYVIGLVGEHKPDKIVLAAEWTSYDWKALAGTISRLHGMGFNNIDLIGPVPQWRSYLQRELYAYFILHLPHEVPNRMTYGLRTNFQELDPLMANFAKAQHVNYISPKSILCNDKGCLTMVGDTIDSLTSWDSSHLTRVGSEFLVSKFPK
jgi:peptidoglycan/LPS O-acetylase OafA/YrhL